MRCVAAVVCPRLCYQRGLLLLLLANDLRLPRRRLPLPPVPVRKPAVCRLSPPWNPAKPRAEAPAAAEAPGCCPRCQSPLCPALMDGLDG